MEENNTLIKKTETNNDISGSNILHSEQQNSI